MTETLGILDYKKENKQTNNKTLELVLTHGPWLGDYWHRLRLLSLSSPHPHTQQNLNRRHRDLYHKVGLYHFFPAGSLVLLCPQDKVKPPTPAMEKPRTLSLLLSSSSWLRGALASVLYYVVLLDLCKSRARQVPQAAWMGWAHSVRHTPPLKVTGGR